MQPLELSEYSAASVLVVQNSNVAPTVLGLLFWYKLQHCGYYKVIQPRMRMLVGIGLGISRRSWPVPTAHTMNARAGRARASDDDRDSRKLAAT